MIDLEYTFFKLIYLFIYYSNFTFYLYRVVLIYYVHFIYFTNVIYHVPPSGSIFWIYGTLKYQLLLIVWQPRKTSRKLPGVFMVLRHWGHFESHCNVLANTLIFIIS